MSNLTIAHAPVRWNLPTLLISNARSVRHKMDELQCVSDTNSVECVIVSESWLEDEMPMEPFELQGFHPAQHIIRSNRVGGGVSVYIHESIPQLTAHKDLEDPSFETKWVTARPKLLPREFSILIVVGVYHPPNAPNWPMICHIQTNMELLLQKHPQAGIIIGGDLNDLKLSFLCSSFKLKQIVSCKTRGENTLDKILTNMASFYAKPFPIGALGSSDHQTVVATPIIPPKRRPPQRIVKYVRCPTHDDKIQMAEMLRSVPWEDMYKLPSCESQFEFFHGILSDTINTLIPLQKKVSYTNDKPWITPAFKSLVARRQKALLSGDIPQYNRLRNQVNRDRELLPKNFYSSTLEKLGPGFSRGWWKTVKTLLGMNSSSNALQNFASSFYDGDMDRLSNEINEFLASVSDDLDRLPPADPHPNADYPPVPNEFVIPVEDTFKQLAQVKTCKAIGPDGIPNWVLKEFADIIAGPLCAIQNSSLRESFIPLLWRSANITPLPKLVPMKDIKKDVRPIALTPVMAKLTEYHQVKAVNKICGTVDRSQYGCEEGTSTTHTLISILHPVYKVTDDSKFFGRLELVDFSKAFDHIHHQKSLKKLEDNGVPPILLNWFTAFLRDRKQRVKVGDITSEWKSPNGGVPQGTLSGPMIFKHMVSDLHTNLPDEKFMDDTTLVETSAKSVGSTMQQASDQVCDWSKTNQLGLNTLKTKDMVYSFGHSPDLQPIIMNGAVIERVDSSKLLGVHIQNNLKWDTHIEYINKKASSRLYFLRCLKRAGLSKSELVTIYISSVRSICEYACAVWSTSLTQELSDALESIQRRAFKIISPGLSYELACVELRLEPLYERRLAICRKLFNDMQKPDHRLHGLLPPPRTIKYGLRTMTKYPQPKCKTNRYKNSFVPFCLFNFQ